MQQFAWPVVAARSDQVGGALEEILLCPGCLGIEPLSEQMVVGWVHRSSWGRLRSHKVSTDRSERWGRSSWSRERA